MESLQASFAFDSGTTCRGFASSRESRRWPANSSRRKNRLSETGMCVNQGHPPYGAPCDERWARRCAPAGSARDSGQTPVNAATGTSHRFRHSAAQMMLTAHRGAYPMARSGLPLTSRIGPRRAPRAIFSTRMRSSAIGVRRLYYRVQADEEQWPRCRCMRWRTFNRPCDQALHGPLPNQSPGVPYRSPRIMPTYPRSARGRARASSRTPGWP